MGAAKNALQNQALLETQVTSIQAPVAQAWPRIGAHASPAALSDPPWGTQGDSRNSRIHLTLRIFQNKCFHWPVCFHLSLGTSHFLLF